MISVLQSDLKHSFVIWNLLADESFDEGRAFFPRVQQYVQHSSIKVYLINIIRPSWTVTMTNTPPLFLSAAWNTSLMQTEST